MNFDEALVKYVNKEKRPRQIGRYYASEIISIKKGYLTPKSFFDIKDIDLMGCKRIMTGNLLEQALNAMLKKAGIQFNYNCEEGKSKEIRLDDEIIIAVKPDFEFKTCVFETKATSKSPQDSLEYYKYQLECEYQVTKKPVYLVQLGVDGNVWRTPQAYRYQESEEVFNEIKEIISDFHKKLCLTQNKK